MNIFRKIFKRKRIDVDKLFPCWCVYQFLKKHTREVDVNGHFSYEVDDVYIYCPKCRKRKCVSALEWELIQKQQKIDFDFMSKNRIEDVVWENAEQ